MLKLSDVLNECKGRFFTVYFTKKDGSARVLNGLLGVKKHLSGGENLNPNLKNNGTQFVVWDRNAGGYRTVTKANISKVVANGVAYTPFEVNGDAQDDQGRPLLHYD